MLSRQHTLDAWLKEILGELPFQISPLAGDASFRRYYRVSLPKESLILMDAEQEKKSIVPFITIGETLSSHNIITPQIYASNKNEGLILLSDFGDQLLLNSLHAKTAEHFYKDALDILLRLQKCESVRDWVLPTFTDKIMLEELFLFKEWFLERYLEIELSEKDHAALDKVFHTIVAEVSKQPYVFMHRDYHSANIMVLPNQTLGILDFQDAFYGPITYDLVSLLRDCYISWPDEFVKNLALGFFKNTALPVSPEEFLRMFDLMGLQRHLKALLTFSRKYVRDQNKNYLQHIPRTVNYILKTGHSYPECLPLINFLKEKIPEHIQCVG